MSNVKVRDTMGLPDVQEYPDLRGKAIPKVGIKNVRVPVAIFYETSLEPTVCVNRETAANVSIYVDLDAEKKGVNMSRYILTLYEWIKQPLSKMMIEGYLSALREKMGVNDAYVKFRFPIFVNKPSPATNIDGPEYYDVTWEARQVDGKTSHFYTVVVQYISTCTCSHELSRHLEENGDRGNPHQQRSFATVTIQLDPDNGPTFTTLIKTIERAVQTLPYPVIKRLDERALARECFYRTMFCEDAGRDIALSLDRDERILDYVAVCVHEESIHRHEVVSVMRKYDHGGLR